MNDTYYGIAKVGGNRKEHSLGSADRKLAERKLKQWLSDLKTTEGSQAQMTLGQLLEKYQLSFVGKKPKTQQTRMSILKRFRETWPLGERVRVSSIVTSNLVE